MSTSLKNPVPAHIPEAHAVHHEPVKQKSERNSEHVVPE